MRGYLALSLLILGSGCQGPLKSLQSSCETMCDTRAIESSRNACPENSTCQNAPSSRATAVATKADCRRQEEIYVKAPPQKVVVEIPGSTPQAAQVQAAPQSAPMVPMISMATAQAAPYAPQMATAQAASYAVPQGIAPLPMMMQAAPQTVMASSVQTTSAPHARLTLGFDSFSVRIPYPRLYAVPGPQEVTTETQYYTQQQAFGALAVAAPQVQVAQSYGVAQAQYAVPNQAVVAQPQMQMGVPNQAVLAQPQMQVAVPTQGVIAQPQVAVPYAVSPPPLQMLAVTANTADAEQAIRTRTRKMQLDELQKQVQALEQAIGAQAGKPCSDELKLGADKGSPLPPIGGK